MNYFLTEDYYVLSYSSYLLYFLLIVVFGILQYRNTKIEITENKQFYLQNICTDFIYIFCGILFVCVNRMYSVYCERTNIDESFDLAVFSVFVSGGHFWKDFDLTSVGPINTLLFNFVYLFTNEVSYFTAKVAALLVVVISFVFLYLSLIKLTNRFVSYLLTATYAFYMVVPWSAPIVSYNTEYSLLLFLPIWFFCFTNFDNKLARYFSFFILGLLPLCKLQFSPMALLLFIVSMIRVCGGYQQLFKTLKNLKLSKLNCNFKEIAICCVVTSIPFLILLTDCIINDSFIWFYRFYIENMFSYLDIANSDNAVILYWEHFIFFWSTIDFLYIYTSVAFILLIIGFCKKQFSVSIFVLLLVVVSIYEVLKPGNLFYHYTNIMILPILYAIAIIVGKIKLKFVNVVLSIVCLFYLTSSFLKFDNYFRTKYDLLIDSQNIDIWKYIGTDIKNKSQKGDKLVVWGWQDDVYIYSTLPPAVANIGLGTLVPSPFVPRKYPLYNREKFITDMNNNKPRFFLDTPSPITERYNSYSYSVVNDPDLGPIISNDYHIYQKYFVPVDGIKECSFVENGITGCYVYLYERNN